MYPTVSAGARWLICWFDWRLFLFVARAELGLSGEYIDISAVQQSFGRWSSWGQTVQWVQVVLTLSVLAVFCVIDFSRNTRLRAWMATLCFVTLGQIAVFIVPPFVFQFHIDIAHSVNVSLLDDPGNRLTADQSLNVLFDGVTLTFISGLYVFMLHTIPTGVLLGSFVFIMRLNATDHVNPTGAIRRRRARRRSFGSADDQSSPLRAAITVIDGAAASATSHHNEAAVRTWAL